MLPSIISHSSFTKSVMMSVAVSKVGVVLCLASSEKSMDSIGWISYCLNKCQLLLNTLSTTILFEFQQNSSCMHQRMVHATPFNSCCAKLSISFLLSYGPNSPELNSIDQRIQGVYSRVNMSCKSTKLKKSSSDMLNAEKDVTFVFPCFPGSAEALVK